MTEISPCLWFDTEGEDAANRDVRDRARPLVARHRDPVDHGDVGGVAVGVLGHRAAAGDVVAKWVNRGQLVSGRQRDD